jgi:two-component system, cell cycle response regulator
VLAAAVSAVIVTRLRRRLAAAERRRETYRFASTRIGEELGASPDRASLVRVMLDVSSRLVDADAAVFWVDVGPHVEARVGHGRAVDTVGRRVQRGEGLVGWVADQVTASHWPVAANRPAPAEPTASCALAVPILARGRLYGVLSLYRRGPGESFDEGDLADVTSVACQVGSAIDTTFLYDETRRQSLTDGLTGLWNRRQFELRLNQELERTARFGGAFSIVMADLDGFKGINDGFGHSIGDAVLVAAAERLITDTREVDVVARYGGEEFVLLLPETDLDGGVRVAEKIRQELAERPIDTDVGPLTVTVSVGVATHPDHGADPEELLSAADMALYQAKARGKNQVRAAMISKSRKSSHANRNLGLNIVSLEHPPETGAIDA